MSSFPNATASSRAHSSTAAVSQESSGCTCKKMIFALLIIATIGGLLSAGIGLWGYGAHRAFWPAGFLPDFGQMSQVILMSVGGGTAFFSFTILVIKGCCDPFRTTPPQAPPLSDVEVLRQELEEWESEILNSKKDRILHLKNELLKLSGEDRDLEDEFDAKKEVFRLDRTVQLLPDETLKKEDFRWEIDRLIAEMGDLYAVKEQIIECYTNKTTYLSLGCLLYLTSLPPAIGKLSHLEMLRINNMQIESLPKEIGRLSSLKNLNVENNLLTSLPVELCNLTRLETLSLTDNPLTSYPQKVRSFCEKKKVKLAPQDIFIEIDKQHYFLGTTPPRKNYSESNGLPLRRSLFKESP